MTHDIASRGKDIATLADGLLRDPHSPDHVIRYDKTRLDADIDAACPDAIGKDPVTRSRMYADYLYVHGLPYDEDAMQDAKDIERECLERLEEGEVR
jgi:hypothetical protein